ncbi:MAG TPA: DUF2252 family protein [Polyangiales bacterium]|nr:DUF2252 family protein [Polyangiales bacterium]
MLGTLKRSPIPRSRRQRQEVLLHRQRLKMASSAHAYVRGSTAKFYEWLESAPGAGLPEGPAIWICGDCHVGNLGPVAHADGRIALQIRDLDQSVIGNPAHDLVRLALSLAMAARGADLPGATTALMIEQVVAGYERALTLRAPQRDERSSFPAPVRFVMRQAVRRSWKHLMRERLEDTAPTIPLGERFWPLTRSERRAVGAMVETPELQSLFAHDEGGETELLDAAYWMKGCSSLGKLRLALLVRVQGKLRLVDVKEAVQAYAPRYPDSGMPNTNAERVVQGARALSPYLGERMVATRLLDRAVFVRELLPQDLKLELDALSKREASEVARYLAEVVGRAHARQLGASERKAWRSELRRRRPKSIEAPSWLWGSVVELVSSHEAAYLNHCRRYALEHAR